MSQAPLLPKHEPLPDGEGDEGRADFEQNCAVINLGFCPPSRCAPLPAGSGSMVAAPAAAAPADGAAADASLPTLVTALVPSLLDQTNNKHRS